MAPYVATGVSDVGTVASVTSELMVFLMLPTRSMITAGQSSSRACQT